MAVARAQRHTNTTQTHRQYTIRYRDSHSRASTCCCHTESEQARRTDAPVDAKAHKTSYTQHHNVQSHHTNVHTVFGDQEHWCVRSKPHKDFKRGRVHCRRAHNNAFSSHCTPKLDDSRRFDTENHSVLASGGAGLLGEPKAPKQSKNGGL